MYSSHYPDMWDRDGWSTFGGATESKYSILRWLKFFTDKPGSTGALYNLRLEVTNALARESRDTASLAKPYRNRSHHTIWTQRHNPIGPPLGETSTNGWDYKFIAGEEEHPHCGAFNGGKHYSRILIRHDLTLAARTMLA